jgi:glycosyltransferase involved in cell wall biosynthesis
VIFSDMDSWFSEVHPDMKKLWYRKYYSFNYALENSDLVDFLSPYIAEGIKERNIKINRESISVAPCSFSDYSKCFVGDKKDFEIAFCARLEPDKNPMMFLEAAKILSGKYSQLKFHLLGEGTFVNEIEEFIERNNLKKNVNFRFHRNPPEIFSNTSIFVSIQTNTNYPSQSVLEAMACGNAIIASDTGDTNLFINNDNGILIKLSTEELVKGIDYLIQNPEITRKLGNNAGNFVIKNHTIQKYTDYFLKLVHSTYEKNF